MTSLPGVPRTRSERVVPTMVTDLPKQKRAAWATGTTAANERVATATVTAIRLIEGYLVRRR